MTEPNQETDPASSIYDEFLAEREEVMKHKWILSEQAHRDVGLEATLVDWALRHREAWRRERSGN